MFVGLLLNILLIYLSERERDRAHAQEHVTSRGRGRRKGTSRLLAEQGARLWLDPSSPEIMT